MAVKNSDTNAEVQALDNKIDKEIANLLATYERYRNDIIKYAGGKDNPMMALHYSFSTFLPCFLDYSLGQLS